MKRMVWRKKLERMLRTIDAGEMPANVREFYVFGSYARGALEPNDLDVAVIHEPPRQVLMDELTKAAKKTARTFFDELTGPQRRFQSYIKRALRKPDGSSGQGSASRGA